MLREWLRRVLDAIRPLHDHDERPAPVSEWIRWGGTRLDATHNTHFCLIGTTRSGKTTLLRIVIQDALLPMLAGANTRAIIYDPKHEIHSVLNGLGLYSRAITLDPFSMESFSWNVSGDVVDDDSAQQIANILVPPAHERGEGESFFTIALRNLTSAVLKAFQRRGRPWALRDVLHAMADLEVMKTLVAPYSDLAKSVENTLQRAETIQDLVSTIENFRNNYTVIAALWHRAELSGRTFCIRDFMSSTNILVMPGPAQPGDHVSTLNQVIFHRLVDSILALSEVDRRGPNPRRIWVFIDELRTAGELVGLERLLSASASKGCRIVLGAQAIEGLRDAQGENKAEEILGLCHNRAFLRAPSATTAEWMSKQFQSRRVSETERTITINDAGESTTWVTRNADRPQVDPRVFLELKSPEWSGALEGMFIAPSLPEQFYHAEVDATRLFQGDSPLVVPQVENEAYSLRRPASHQELLPWTLEDLHRLGLPVYFVGRLRGGEFPNLTVKAIDACNT